MYVATSVSGGHWWRLKTIMYVATSVSGGRWGFVWKNNVPSGMGGGGDGGLAATARPTPVASSSSGFRAELRVMLAHTAATIRMVRYLDIGDIRWHRIPAIRTNFMKGFCDISSAFTRILGNATGNAGTCCCYNEKGAVLGLRKDSVAENPCNKDVKTLQPNPMTYPLC